MIKRIFDIVFSIAMFLLLAVPIFFAWIGSIIDTKSNGLFLQDRIGQFGEIFQIFKFRSIHSSDDSISFFGRFIRKFKIDELPQLLNVLIGNMSVVGPRPDIPGYYDKLEGDDKLILSLKPGLTSEAAIKYSNEEELLAAQKCPKKYNDEVIFPDKVKLNLNYYHKQSALEDLKIVCKTIVVIFKRS